MKKGLVILIYCKTAMQVADIFTKQLFQKHFERLRRVLMGHENWDDMVQRMALRPIDPPRTGFPDTPRSTDSANTKSEYRRLKAHNGPDLNRLTAVMAYLTAAGLNFGRYAVVTAVI